MNNLANTKEYEELQASLLAQMENELTAQGDPRMAGNGHIFDEYTYAFENVRGFYERYMNGEKLNTGWVNDSDFEAAPLD